MEGNNNSKKDMILKVVLDYITNHNEFDITIREIGRLAGVNSAAVSYYFGSKDNLIKEASKYYYISSNEIFKDLENKNIKPRERMISFCMNYSEHMLKYIGFLKAHISSYIVEKETECEMQDWLGTNIEEIRTTIKEHTKITDEEILNFKAIQLISSMVYPTLMNKYKSVIGGMDYCNYETRKKYYDSLIDSILHN
jgi:AcrR family transcriptional regulator